MALIEKLAKKFQPSHGREENFQAEEIFTCEICQGGSAWLDVYGGGPHCDRCRPAPARSLIARRIEPHRLQSSQTGTAQATAPQTTPRLGSSGEGGARSFPPLFREGQSQSVSPENPISEIRFLDGWETAPIDSPHLIDLPDWFCGQCGECRPWWNLLGEIRCMNCERPRRVSQAMKKQIRKI